MKFNKWISFQIEAKTELIKEKKSALQASKKELKKIHEADFTALESINRYIAKLENDIRKLRMELDQLKMWKTYKPVRTKTGVAVHSKILIEMIKKLESKNIEHVVTHTNNGLIIEYGKGKACGTLELYAIQIPEEVELPPLELGEVVQSV